MKILRSFCMLMAVLCIITSAFAESELNVERHFAAPTYYDHLITVPTGITYVYYAQNDLLWGNLTYEAKASTKRRPFKDGGCCPTSVAMALRCVVPEEDLVLLNEHYKTAYSICTCSLNEIRCNSHHIRYYITSAKDYDKFLPLVMGDIATGNNDSHVSSRSAAAGTTMSFVDFVADVFDLTVTKTDSISQACAAAAAGCGVVAFAGSGGCFTGTGHYLLFAGCDETYYYFLDPLCRTNYSGTDPDHVVKPINQGLVAIKKTNINQARLYSFTIFSRNTSAIQQVQVQD